MELRRDVSELEFGEVQYFGLKPIKTRPMSGDAQRVVLGRKTFTLPFYVLQSGLRIELTLERLTGEKSNKSLVTCVCGRDWRKLSNSSKWLKPSP